MTEMPGEIDSPVPLAEILAARCDLLEACLQDRPEIFGDETDRAVSRRLVWHGRQILALMSGKGANLVDQALIEFTGHYAPMVIAHCGSETGATSYMIAAAVWAIRMGLTMQDLALDDAAHEAFGRDDATEEEL